MKILRIFAKYSIDILKYISIKPHTNFVNLCELKLNMKKVIRNFNLSNNLRIKFYYEKFKNITKYNPCAMTLLIQTFYRFV